MFRNYWLTFLCIVGSMYFAFEPAYKLYGVPAIRSDGYGYHIWIRHILTGDFNFCAEKRFEKPYGHVAVTVAPESPAGRCGNIYPPGVALTKLPFLVIGSNTEIGSDPTAYEQMVTLVLPILLLSVSVAMLTHALSSWVSAASRDAAIAATVLGTGYYHYAVFDGGFSHVYSAFWVTTAFWASLQTFKWARVLTFISTAMLVLTRNANVILLPALTVAIFVGTSRSGSAPLHSWRFLPWMILGAILGAVVQLGLNRWFSGVWTLSSYGRYEFQFSEFHLQKVLFSYAKGLFTWYPVLIVAVALPLFYARSRILGLAVLVTILLYATLYGFWIDWQLGASFGHRGFIELIPIVAVSFALAIEDCHWRRSIVVASAALTVLTTFLMLAYWRMKVPFAHTTKTQFLSALSGNSLSPSELYLIIVGAAVLTACCLIESTRPHFEEDRMSTKGD